MVLKKKIITPPFAVLKEIYCDRGDISHKKMGHMSVNFFQILKLGTIMSREEGSLKWIPLYPISHIISKIDICSPPIYQGQQVYQYDLHCVDTEASFPLN